MFEIMLSTGSRICSKYVLVYDERGIGSPKVRHMIIYTAMAKRNATSTCWCADSVVKAMMADRK